MWFEVFFSAFLFVLGFISILLGLMGIEMVIEFISISPAISIISAFGVIGIVTIGILIMSGVYRKARKIASLQD